MSNLLKWVLVSDQHGGGGASPTVIMGVGDLNKNSKNIY
jgi:hypothetical protein